jgi:hypothetical protein
VVGANTLEITYTDTEVKLAGGLAGWLDSLPQFTLPSLPEALRVRGDRAQEGSATVGSQRERAAGAWPPSMPAELCHHNRGWCTIPELDPLAL